MSQSNSASVYQLRIYVKGISPMVWRRILVHGDTTIADLHEIMQILMDWYDVHLHHFLIRGKRYGIGRIGTMGFMDNPYKITLDHFHFRLNETFVYECQYAAYNVPGICTNTTPPIRTNTVPPMRTHDAPPRLGLRLALD